MTLLLAVVSISATKQEPHTLPFQQKLLGTWELKQVKEIGSWAIHHRDVTATAQFKRITFKPAFTYSIDIDNHPFEGSWHLEKRLDPNYQPNATVPVLYYPEKTLTLNGINAQFLPTRWEDIVVNKKRLIFYVHHKKGKLKYVLDRT